MKYLLILLFLFSTHSFSEESLKKYTINANGNVEIIEEHKYSKAHSFKNYKITKNEEIKSLKSEFVETRTTLIRYKMESSIKRRLADQGIKPSTIPPIKIKINVSN